MQNFTTLLSLLLLITAPVFAISKNEAFKRDWIAHTPGPSVKHALLDNRTLLELSENKFLYYKDISSLKITRYIDLSLHNSDDFKVGESTIATFSRNSKTVSVFDKHTGIFISSISLKFPPIHLESYSGTGWSFLQEGEETSELVTWDGTQLHNLGKFYARSFLQYSVPNNTFICIDSSAFSLTLKKNNEPENSGVVVTDADYESTFNLLFPPGIIDTIKLTSENKSPLYLTDDCVVSHFDKDLVIYKVLHDGHKILYQKFFDEIKQVLFSEPVLVIITDVKAHILDLGVFLDDFLESSIKSKFVEISPDSYSPSLSAGHFTTLYGASDNISVYDYDVKLGSYKVSKIPNSIFSATGGGIIADVPPISKIEEAHHFVEDSRSSSILYRWLLRIKTHLSQLGQFTVQILSKNEKESAGDSFKEDVFGFNKIVVEIDEARAILAAKSSINGNSVWTHAFATESNITEVKILGTAVYVALSNTVEVLDLNTGAVISSRSFEKPIEKFVVLKVDNRDEIDETLHSKTLAVKIGERLEFLSESSNVSPQQYYFHKDSNFLQSYFVDGDRLRPTWHWNKPDERLLSVTKNTEAMTSAGGITRFDRSVLYKYLNPNLVSIVSETKEGIKLTLVDGITGAVIYTNVHRGELVDPDSIQITQSDNWVVYSAFVTSPVSEQRITVIDLFQDQKDFKTSKTAFETTNVTISTKSFVYPERILALESTNTKFGVTVKSIIALTDSGSLVEIPKYFLNSRRVDGRQMTSEDQMDDFRMFPYEPLIQHNTFKVLNHKNKIQLSSKKQSILIAPTELESTSVVCFVNELNDFCTIVQPSSSYDLLSPDFDKFNLVVTIVVLLAVYIFTKPLVASKKLDMKWID